MTGWLHLNAGETGPELTELGHLAGWKCLFYLSFLFLHMAHYRDRHLRDRSNCISSWECFSWSKIVRLQGLFNLTLKKHIETKTGETLREDTKNPTSLQVLRLIWNFFLMYITSYLILIHLVYCVKEYSFIKRLQQLRRCCMLHLIWLRKQMFSTQHWQA